MMNRRKARASQANGRSKMKLGWNPFVEVVDLDPRGADGAERCWANNMFVVFWVPAIHTDWGMVERLMVRRNDGGTSVSWADKQRIKNEILGPERVALEVFPPVSELLDNRNIYHLWVLPAGFPMPFGID